MPRKANRSGPSRNGAAAPGEPGASTEDLFRQYTRTRELAMRDLLIGRHTHLVQAVARRFTGMGESAEDLVQEGTMGLINAVDLFDVDRGVKFTTYATHLIAGQVQHYLRDRGRIIRQPAWVQELTGKIMKVTEALVQELHRPPTNEEVAQRLNVPEATVEQVLRSKERVKVRSLDAAADDDDGGSGLDLEKMRLVQPAPQMGIEDRILLQAAIAELKDLERKVVRFFFFHDLNQTEIARRLGISVNYASYLLRRALGKLRDVFEEAMRVPEEAPEEEMVVPTGIDAATGLPTAAYFKERLRQEIARARRNAPKSAPSFTVIFLESAGSAVESLVPLVRKRIRLYDVAARISETVLAVLFPGVAGQAAVLADRLLASAAAMQGASVGYAVYPRDGDTVEVLVTKAQEALARAAASGGNQVCAAA
jgi:RNA polymerase sigma-B factor